MLSWKKFKEMLTYSAETLILKIQNFHHADPVNLQITQINASLGSLCMEHNHFKKISFSKIYPNRSISILKSSNTYTYLSDLKTLKNTSLLKKSISIRHNIYYAKLNNKTFSVQKINFCQFLDCLIFSNFDQSSTFIIALKENQRSAV